MNPLTKRHCSNSSTNPHPIQLATPISSQPLVFPQPFKNVPTGVLKYNFVSYLSFIDQSCSMAGISKAFNILATFAREEQDWLKHTVDVSNDKRNEKINFIYFRYYLEWQKLRQTFQLDNLNTKTNNEIFSNKIKLITKLVNVTAIFARTVFDSALPKFDSSALPKDQMIKLKNIDFNLYPGEFSNIDRIFEKFSIVCPELENVTIIFNNTLAVNPNPHIYFDGLANLLENCSQVKFHIKNLHHKSDLQYLSQTNTQCVSLNSNFVFSLSSLSTSLDLDDDLCPILERCAQLSSFEAFRYDMRNAKLTENFIYALSHCAQLNTVTLSDYPFEANNKSDLTSSYSNYDYAFSHLFKRCTQLRQFYYTAYIPLGDATFQSIVSHPNLEDITIAITPSDQILKNTSISTSLKKFKLCNLVDNEESTKDFNRTIIAITRFFPNLREFHNHNTKPIALLDQTMANLSYLPYLNKVYFNFIHPSFIDAFNNLANCPNLDLIEFNLHRSSIKAKNFEVKKLLNKKFDLISCNDLFGILSLKFSPKKPRNFLSF